MNRIKWKFKNLKILKNKYNFFILIFYTKKHILIIFILTTFDITINIIYYQYNNKMIIKK